MKTVGIKETKAGVRGQQPHHLNVDGWGSTEGALTDELEMSASPALSFT
jgi:hypothetical protein